MGLGSIGYTGRFKHPSKDPQDSPRPKEHQQPTSLENARRQSGVLAKPKAEMGQRPPLGWLVSPRPAGLGFPPCGRRLSDNGSYPFLESVESLVCPIAAVARPAGLGEAGWPPSGPSRPLNWPRLCSALGHSPGKWVLEILVTLGCLVNLWMDVEAFRCIHLNQGPTLDSKPLECVTLPLVRSRGYVFGVPGRPA